MSLFDAVDRAVLAFAVAVMIAAVVTEAVDILVLTIRHWKETR